MYVSLQAGFSDGNYSYSLLPGTNASDNFNFSLYFLDSGLCVRIITAI